MAKPEKTLTETTRSHMHDHHANSQSKVKIKILEKICEINYNFMAKSRDQFSFPCLLALYVGIQKNNFQKKFVVCSVSR